MAFTVEDVIEAGRDPSPAFDQHQTPDSVLLRSINRKHRALYQDTMRIEPTILVETETITISSFDFDAGHALPAYDKVVGGDLVLIDVDTPDDFKLVSWHQRHRASVRRAGYILEETLYLQGKSEDWDDAEKIELVYVPQVNELTSKTDNLQTPDRSQSVFELYAAMVCARRGVDGKPHPLYPDLRQEVEEEELEYKNWLVQRESAAETTTIHEEW